MLRRSGLEPDPVLDRDGQNEPAAVVGVLADEVDPSRRPDAEPRLVHLVRGLRHAAQSLAPSAPRPAPRGDVQAWSAAARSTPCAAYARLGDDPEDSIRSYGPHELAGRVRRGGTQRGDAGRVERRARAAARARRQPSTPPRATGTRRTNCGPGSRSIATRSSSPPRPATARGPRRDSIHRSLDRMGVTSVDLIQLHNLVHPGEWEQALGSGGALEAVLEARDEGSFASSASRATA